MVAILLQGTPVPFTGFLLCFVPLATIILGLITFFVITDRHASRPYLRYNPFVAATTTDEEQQARPAAVGETPAGSLGGHVPAGETAVFLGERGAVASVPKEAVPPPAAPDRPAALSGEPPMNAPKDLGRVTGVNLPNVDQRPDPLQEPPPAVAPPSQAEAQRAPVVSKAPAQAAPPVAGATAAQGLAISYIEFNPAGSDLEGEYVRIQNSTASAVDMTGWTLRDTGQKHSFVFPAFTLAPGAEVRLWTKRGANDAANVYWGQRGAVWNNTGDTAILLDAAGNEVSRFSYQGKK